jgi:hypothetical protein
MTLPFTLHQFLDVFRRYNESVWPMQWVLNALAIAAVLATLSRGRGLSRLATGIVAALWLWTGVAYHVVFFRTINPVALLFGLAFIAEAALIAWLGGVRQRLQFDLRADVSGRVGAALIAYALVAYPLISYALGHRYPAAPTFGVPCPTTIFTFGMILLCRPPRPRVLIVIPVLWSLLGVVAALRLGMWEDVGLVIAAILVTFAVLNQRSDASRAAARDPLAAASVG